MKNLFFLLFSIVLLNACETQKQRYVADSGETRVLESGISAYKSGDWNIW
jgi:hypothetical protein